MTNLQILARIRRAERFGLRVVAYADRVVVLSRAGREIGRIV